MLRLLFVVVEGHHAVALPGRLSIVHMTSTLKVLLILISYLAPLSRSRSGQHAPAVISVNDIRVIVKLFHRFVSKLRAILEAVLPRVFN